MVSNEELESEEKYKAIFEGASDGILIADIKTKKFILANPKICEITGYPLKELLELDVNGIHPKKDLPYVLDQFKKQAQGKITLAKNIPVLRKDKKIIYCDIDSASIKIGKKKYLAGFFRDNTEQKKIEEELKKARGNLQEKVEELERFNRIAIGRELKMIELKKEINELYKKLEENPKYDTK